MWWTIMQALNAHLVAYFAAETSLTPTIQNGASASVPETLTIELVRGPGEADDRLRNRRGKQTLFVQCWAYSEVDANDEDQRDGYDQLQEMEAHTLAALQTFAQQQVPVDGLHIVGKPATIEPDGDAFRPSVGSRIPFEMTWTRINP